MTYGTKPIKPVEFNIRYRYDNGKDIDFPVGSLRIDPLDEHYKKYQSIAKSNILGGGIELNPLWFVLLDNEYGIQDNVRHEYAEIRPFMRAEPIRYYSGSDSENVEFMVRFFAFRNPMMDVHVSYEYLMALQYPWIDMDNGYKYPPPRLILSLNSSVTRTGYITASNITWYNPVGIGAEINLGRREKPDSETLKENFAVSFYMEAMLTFTVVGSQYNSVGFNGVHSANQFLANVKRFINANSGVLNAK